MCKIVSATTRTTVLTMYVDYDHQYDMLCMIVYDCMMICTCVRLMIMMIMLFDRDVSVIINLYQWLCMLWLCMTVRLLCMIWWYRQMIVMIACMTVTAIYDQFDYVQWSVLTVLYWLYSYDCWCWLTTIMIYVTTLYDSVYWFAELPMTYVVYEHRKCISIKHIY